MPNNKTKSKQGNSIQKWWDKLSSSMKIVIVSGSIAGCFGFCIAVVTLAGSIYLAFLNNNLNNPPAQIHLYPLVTNHLLDSYENTGCIGSIIAIPKDKPTSNQIIVGESFKPENLEEFAIVSPIYTYLNLEADLPDAEFATIENITVSIEKFESPNKEAIIIIPKSICAGSDPGFPNLTGVFPVHISPKINQLSLTESRETKPNDLIYTVTKDKPLMYKLYVNSLDAGWYTISVKAQYHYNGQKGVTSLDKPISIYVPDKNHIAEMFYADWNDNNKLKVVDSKTQVDILDENQKLRENWLIMTLETPIQNPEVTNEYIRIENLGLEQDMTGWAIEGQVLRNIGGNVRSTPTFIFPDFILPEWGVVRIWSGKGNNKNIDLYWNLDQAIWSEITELTNIVLLNKSGEIVNTVLIP